MVHVLLFVQSSMPHLAQQLTEKRKSLCSFQIPYLEISIKSYFCAKQLLTSSRSYLTTPTCESRIIKLGTDFLMVLKAKPICFFGVDFGRSNVIFAGGIWPTHISYCLQSSESVGALKWPSDNIYKALFLSQVSVHAATAI